MISLLSMWTLSEPYAFACWKLGVQQMVQEHITVVRVHYEAGCVPDFQSENDAIDSLKSFERDAIKLHVHNHNE